MRAHYISARTEQAKGQRLALFLGASDNHGYCSALAFQANCKLIYLFYPKLIKLNKCFKPHMFVRCAHSNRRCAQVATIKIKMVVCFSDGH
jgi:hypothetical protein